VYLQLRMRLKDSATVSAEGLLATTPRSIEAALAADAGIRTATTGLQSALSDTINSGSYATSSGIPSSSASPQWASAAALPRSPSAAAANAARASFSSSGLTLQHVVAEHLGLTPVEEGRGMLHYVIPQALAPQLQGLLELLDMPEKQQLLGLAEVHVSLASLEEVFLTVVKQVGGIARGCGFVAASAVLRLMSAYTRTWTAVQHSQTQMFVEFSMRHCSHLAVK
jgi:hypothetical protein